MDIVLAGSIAIDYLMRFPGHFKDSLIEQSLDKISISLLADEMQKLDGGVSANIAYTMALLGGKPRLFGTVGQDFGEYRQRLEAVGVDTSNVVQLDDVFTGSFFVNTDLDNNQIAFFYAGAMGLAGNYGLDRLSAKPDLVVVSPNAPDAMQRHAAEAAAQGIPYFYDPSQQVPRLSGEMLKAGIDGCTYLACNEYEWEVIQKNTGYTLDNLLAKNLTFIHTLGGDGTNIYSAGEIIHVPVVPPTQINDPTGAGDAFRGGFLRGLELGLGLEIAGQMGTLCASYCLERVGTQTHHFSLAEFVERFRQHYDDKGALDALLA